MNRTRTRRRPLVPIHVGVANLSAAAHRLVIKATNGATWIRVVPTRNRVSTACLAVLAATASTTTPASAGAGNTIDQSAKPLTVASLVTSRTARRSADPDAIGDVAGVRSSIYQGRSRGGCPGCAH